MFKKNDVVRVGKNRTTVRPGAVGTVQWTWPKGHPWRGRYFYVRVKDKTHVLAAGVLRKVQARRAA